MKYVDQLKYTIADYLSSQPLRTKKGILDFGGDVLKFLFGTLTQPDARKYDQHITQLEEEQKEFFAYLKRTNDYWDLQLLLLTLQCTKLTKMKSFWWLIKTFKYNGS